MVFKPNEVEVETEVEAHQACNFIQNMHICLIYTTLWERHLLVKIGGRYDTIVQLIRDICLFSHPELSKQYTYILSGTVETTQKVTIFRIVMFHMYTILIEETAQVAA